MKRLLHTSIIVTGLLLATGMQAQPCDPITPIFVANLTGSLTATGSVPPYVVTAIAVRLAVQMSVLNSY
jgi:hypothetical protein